MPIFKSLYFKPSLYRKFCDRCKKWTEENPEFPVPVPRHIKSLFQPYACSYDEVNADGSPFGVKDTLPKDGFHGVYIGGLNCDDVMGEVSGKFLDWTPVYGVCDNASQAVEHIERNRKGELREGTDYVLVLCPMFKKNQPPVDGWRWCKWGSYIGKREVTADYLYNEAYIDALFVYNVFAVLPERG